MITTVTDKISLRKIRYDVISHLEMLDFINKIGDFLDNREDYRKNTDYYVDLLRSANLDVSETDYDKICEMLQKYVDEHNDIDNIEHLMTCLQMRILQKQKIDLTRFCYR